MSNTYFQFPVVKNNILNDQFNIKIDTFLTMEVLLCLSNLRLKNPGPDPWPCSGPFVCATLMVQGIVQMAYLAA